MIREMPPTRHRSGRRGRRTPQGTLTSTSIVSPEVLAVFDQARSPQTRRVAVGRNNSARFCHPKVADAPAPPPKRLARIIHGHPAETRASR
jgi:hypothetical protein